MTARRWAVVLGLVVALVVAAAAWLGFSARSAYADLTAARDELVAARDAIAARDGDAAVRATTSAAGHASRAADMTSGFLWDLAAALPTLGDTPQAVRAIADSLDQAVGSLAPAVADVAGLSAETVLGPNGAVDGGAALEVALPALRRAQAGVAGATSTIASAPSLAAGALVPEQVDTARAQLADELDSLAATLDTMVAVGEIAPPLLGVDEPKRYFVAILNPNEARGTGGFLGSWAIVRAEDGRLSVEQVGSNEQLTRFAEVPIDLGEEFERRYGRDANEVGNFNLSPHFPNAAQLWLASWEARYGERLDGAISADVLALGDLVAAGGGSVPLPEGGSVDGQELTELALTGIYEEFPTAEESAARTTYQNEVASAAVVAVTRALAADPSAVASALGRAISEHRVLAWVRDPDLQEAIAATPLGGSLAVPDGPSVTFVALNSSASKLDTYLDRATAYEVGTCAVDDRGMTRSRLTVTLTNDVPTGELPPYVISQADVGPDGPINSALAQVHLPNGAQILRVQVDGEDAFHSPFTEQGRPSTVLELDLPPRRPRTLVVDFLEPAVDRDPAAPAQPLNLPMETTITSGGC